MPRSPRGSMAVGSDTKAEPLSRGATADDEDDEDSDEDEILETSENGRWQKIAQQVTRDVPGVDAAHLAIDTDDGVEVVWNEVRYSNRKIRGSKERLKKILQRLIEVKHNNIVNFIDFWHDKVEQQQDRLVFITEYMTSGSLLQFLKRAKKTKKTISLKMWRRWCRQILSALRYLHKNDIVHGNLSLASIFIQHNGLIKIGSVSPDAIHEHVKTKIEDASKRLHYTAPESADEGPIKVSADIYSFGVCALEMLNLDLLGNGDGRPCPVKPESIARAVEGLEGPRRHFIRLCLSVDPSQRHTASALLKLPVLQEVFCLKVLTTLALSQRVTREKLEAELDRRSLLTSQRAPDMVLAESYGKTLKVSQAPPLDLDKLFEEIALDVLYEPRPHTTLSPPKKDDSSSRAAVPSTDLSTTRNSAQFWEKESRRIKSVVCEVKTEGGKRELLLRLMFDDKMERELRSDLKDEDDAAALAYDLVLNGLVNTEDQLQVREAIIPKLQHVADAQDTEIMPL